MLKATLLRTQDDKTCTLGLLIIHGSGMTFCTLEEPWKDNKRGISCIPNGTYKVVPHGWEAASKVRFKRAYRLLGTEPRTAILIHRGNTVDDIEGCILVGTNHGTLRGKAAVLNSEKAMNALRGIIGQKEFTLEIKGFQKEEPVPAKPTRLAWWQRLTNRKA